MFSRGMTPGFVMSGVKKSKPAALRGHGVNGGYSEGGCEGVRRTAEQPPKMPMEMGCCPCVWGEFREGPGK